MLETVLILGSYLLGSLSAAIIVCKLMGLPDPRLNGSNNPGATNVLRIGGKKAAFLVLLLDGLKGFLPVIIGQLLHLPQSALAMMAFAAIFGHTFPVFFGFKGGKGVATTAGAIIALSPTLTLVSGITWLVVLGLSRISSLASLVTLALTPIYALLLNLQGFIIPLFLVIILIFWRHKDNIVRLAQGTEPLVGKK